MISHKLATMDYATPSKNNQRIIDATQWWVVVLKSLRLPRIKQQNTFRNNNQCQQSDLKIPHQKLSHKKERLRNVYHIYKLAIFVILWFLWRAPGVMSLPTPPPPPIGGPPLGDSDWGDSPPPAHVYGGLAHGLVLNLPQRLGLVDPSDNANCTNCGMDSHRETFEKIKLEQFQQELLRRLNMSQRPNISRVVKENSFSKPVSRFLHREMEELRQNRQQRFGTSNFPRISEIVSYGEEDDTATNFSDNAMVMFRLSTSAKQPGALKVMSASLYMLLRYRKPGGRSHGSSSKPRRRVKVNIYPVYPGQNPHELESDMNKTMFGSLGVMVRHTRWQKLILPVSEIQKVVDSSSKVLHLRITCDNCGPDIEPVLASRRSNSRRKVRAGLKRKINKRRPLLIIQTAAEEPESGALPSAGAIGKQQQQQEQQQYRRHVIRKRLAPPFEPRTRQKKQCAPRFRGNKKSRCTKRELWVSFKDLGWDDWILYPKGYYANYCDGSCPSRQPRLFEGNDFYLKPHRFRSGRRRYPYHHSHRKHHKVSPYAYHQVLGEYSKISSSQPKFQPQPWQAYYRDRHSDIGSETCCRPRSMSGLHLIYFDENGNIVKTLLRDMVVEKCGCE